MTEEIHHAAYPIENLDISKDALTTLTRMMDGVEKGNSDIVGTPLSSHNDISTVHDELLDLIDSHDSVNRVLRDIEHSQSEKLGPRSLAKPWSERKTSTLEYFGNESYSGIVGKANRSGDVNARLRPISFENALNYLWNNTNSGLPMLVKKKLAKDGYTRAIWESELREQYPAVLFTRTQEQRKTRDVWGYPMAEIVYETMYFQPLLEVRKRLPWRAALNGPEAVSKAVTKMFDNKSSSAQFVSIDFSGFDKSPPTDIIETGFANLRLNFQPGDSIDRGFDHIADRFVMIGLVTPDGVIELPHAVPSGSKLTNEEDSEIQYLIVLPLILTREVDHDFQIQGDDGAYSTEDPDSLFSVFEDHNLEVNHSKSVVAPNYVVYLQNLFHEDYRNSQGIPGIYPLFRALNRLFFMERWTDLDKIGISGEDFFSIRAISILENCKAHPLFIEFIKLIRRLDDRSLSFDLSSIHKYVKAMENRSGGLINQFSDNVRGIKDFDAYRILKELD
jgi:hypothetical protein